MADSLAERLLRGDKRALARGISLVEDDDPDGWALVKAIYPHTGNAAIVGFTGPPGAGKSTLIGALIKHQRTLERTIAVLSIDPSSPFRGGALLGDRIRLTEHFLDPGVFIRSMATRGALGGLAEAALQTALLMDAAGKDDVYLETVGVGQAEVDVIDHADSVVLVLIPGSGRQHPGAEGRRDGDPGHHRRQQGRPSADGHDGARDPRGAVAGAAGGLARADHQDRGPARRGRGRAGAKLAEHRAHVEAEGTLSERRRRNLMNEVSGSRRSACGTRWRPRCATTPRFRNCSTRSSRAGWTRRARPTPSSPAARWTRAPPRETRVARMRLNRSSSSRCIRVGAP